MTNEQTNEQTIDEIMGQADDYARAYAWRAEEKAALRNMITAALAAKDAEIERLKARLTDSGCDLQALKAEPAPGEWIEWAGGECPIADDARIDVECRDGDVLRDCLPSNLYWSHHADGNYWGDIVAYRVMA